MTFLNKVKTDLEKNKQYDFSSEFWTDELLGVLYDAVYSAKKILKKGDKNKKINTL